ncbi:MAG TPA: type VI secretion system contractile sheath large subunit [Bryobacteraceae bacterium]|nr:type VI secretion system contractile sheath large subunit [Bryobacteraceae bacterium]
MALSSGVTAQPRIRIECKSGGELPLVIGVLGDMTGQPEEPLPRMRDRRFVDVSVDNFDSVLKGCRPSLSFAVRNTLSEDDSKLNVQLKFCALEDFEPEQVARQIGPLRELLDLRGKLADLRTTLQGNDKLDELLQGIVRQPKRLEQLEAERKPEQPKPLAPVSKRAPTPDSGVWSRGRMAADEQPSMLEQIAEASHAETPYERQRSVDLVSEFLNQIRSGEIEVARDTEMMINARIAQIDHLVSVQLNQVLHEPAFQKLEATWRGLYFLVLRTRKAEHVRVRLLNSTRKELLNQFQRERERFSSPLARKVLENTGGLALGLLLGDYEITAHPEDVELLEKMGRLAAHAQTPFVTGAAPELLGLESFQQIPEAFSLERTFESSQYLKLESFRRRAESRYIGITVPHILMRLPYGRDTKAVEGFCFEENVDGTDSSRYLWGSAAWAFGVRAALDFERYGWFGTNRSADDKADLTNLPIHFFCTDDGDVGSKAPAEIVVSDKSYLALRSMGLIPLRQIAGTDRVAFFETWSCKKPITYQEEIPPVTYESVEIDSMLGVSYVAHCLQAHLQEQMQSFSTMQECEEHLNRWISAYVVPDYAKGTKLEAAFPLVEASFKIAPGDALQKLAFIEASLRPKRAVGTMPNPIEIKIPVALPWALGWSAGTASNIVVTSAPVVQPFIEVNGFVSGREQFIRKMFVAEACVTNNKLDAAILVLEDLSEQIDRYHLEEWESPKLVTQVWDLLRRAYLLTAGREADVQERSAALLRRICRLDPTRMIE